MLKLVRTVARKSWDLILIRAHAEPLRNISQVDDDGKKKEEEEDRGGSGLKGRAKADRCQ